MIFSVESAGSSFAASREGSSLLVDAIKGRVTFHVADHLETLQLRGIPS